MQIVRVQYLRLPRFIAFVDDEDYDRVSQKNWYYSKGPYAISGRPVISLHRFILNSPSGEIHHKDGNGLNCQKSNLIVLTLAEHRALNEKFNVYLDGGAWRFCFEGRGSPRFSTEPEAREAKIALFKAKWGERIVSLLPRPTTPEVAEITEFPNSDRGSRGFGSTGR